MANLSQLSYTRQNNNIKVRHNHTKAVWAVQNSWPVVCFLPIFSANLVAIHLLGAVKVIQATKLFLITPQNQTRL